MRHFIFVFCLLLTQPLVAQTVSFDLAPTGYRDGVLSSGSDDPHYQVKARTDGQDWSEYRPATVMPPGWSIEGNDSESAAIAFDHGSADNHSQRYYYKFRTVFMMPQGADPSTAELVIDIGVDEKYVNHDGNFRYDPGAFLNGEYYETNCDGDIDDAGQCQLVIPAGSNFRCGLNELKIKIKNHDGRHGIRIQNPMGRVRLAAHDCQPCANPDTDGDGIANELDIDDDNDGILDLDENGPGDFLNPEADEDGDGIENYLETTMAHLFDTDNDGVPNHHDLDSDNDGIPDVIEGHPSGTYFDQDGDGRIDGNDDGDGDGLLGPADFHESGYEFRFMDTDSDRVTDHLDVDADGDGVTDVWERNSLDQNGDGRVDIDDLNRDGIIDARDISLGVGSDGWSDEHEGLIDLRPGTDLLLGTALLPNSDYKGRPDFRDVDADDDLVPDSLEGQDADADGVADIGWPGSGSDENGNGLDDAFDPNQGGTAFAIPDLDQDGAPDFQDKDSDGDGAGDLTEHGDTDQDGVNDNPLSGDDSDNDGWDDAGDSEPATWNGVHPGVEDMPDLDNDGHPNRLDTDDDGDLVPSKEENPDPNDDLDPKDAQDTDKDGIPDYLDVDDDNDNIPTAEEGPDPNHDGDPSDAIDANRNGIPDYLEIAIAGLAGGATCANTADPSWLGWFIAGLAGYRYLRLRIQNQRPSKS